MADSAPRQPVPAATADPLVDSARGVFRFVCTKNPFYLLSAGFVLHATSLWFRDSSVAGDAWLLMALTGGYILLMASAAFVIVRAGSIWDDARSILVILLILFVQLSLTFDDQLIQDAASGIALLGVGLLFCMAVSEALLLGLRIRLPLLFRLPYHLMLGLLFLYPLVLLPPLHSSEVSALSWRIFLFSPIAAAAILTLIPAVRRRAQYVDDNGTPWHWPWFPWTVFALLAAALGVRSYALSLSFDPVLTLSLAEAMELDAAFDSWFLAPLILAVAVVLLEIGIVEQRSRVQGFALALPAVAVVLAFPGAAGTPPQAAFLEQFIAALASPVLLTVLATALLYGVAALRRVRHADGALALTLLLLSVVDAQTVDLSTLTAPQPIPFAVVAFWQGFVGLRRRDSSRTLLAALCAVAALRAGPVSSLPGFYREFVTLQLILIATLAIGAAFADPFARWLRQVGALMLVLAGIAAAAYPTATAPAVPGWAMPVYILVLAVLAFGWAQVARDPLYVYSGLANVGLIAAVALHQAWLHLRLLPNWIAVRSYLIGLVLLGVALVISGWKAGLVQKLLGRLPRLGSS